MPVFGRTDSTESLHQLQLQYQQGGEQQENVMLGQQSPHPQEQDKLRDQLEYEDMGILELPLNSDESGHNNGGTTYWLNGSHGQINARRDMTTHSRAQRRSSFVAGSKIERFDKNSYYGNSGKRKYCSSRRSSQSTTTSSEVDQSYEYEEMLFASQQ